ncbi:MAG: hypothetical protein IH614_03065 [Desulfuromonadales bacterium]|nr:hypothetical protein [Desulfuromonadales bacterium]
MIHLDLTTDHGDTIYLDVQRIESVRPEGDAFLLTGTLGDGLDEGEVLVEIGEEVTILFVDEWLGGGQMRQLLQRVERGLLTSVLAAAAQQMRFCLQAFPAGDRPLSPQVTGFHHQGRWTGLRPKSYGEQLELPLRVAESAAGWERAA